MADCDPESAGNQEENAEIIPGYKDINAVVQVDWKEIFFCFFWYQIIGDLCQNSPRG